MTQLTIRTHAPTSRAELDRRWSAIRARMKETGIDVLVVGANNDYMGGYLRYIADAPAVMGYPVTLVFPADGPVVMVRMGPIGDELEVPPHPDELWSGPGRMMTTGGFASVCYSNHYDADLAIKALQPHDSGTIGIVGKAQLSAALLDRLRSVLTKATFVDASELVDSVRMVKSEEELAMARRTAELQDTVMGEVHRLIRPGMKDSEVTALARHLASDLGSEQGTYPAGSTAPGEPTYMGLRHWQDRTIGKGDIFYLLLETSGPGGLWAQLGRTCVLGDIPPTLLKEYEFTLAVREYYLGLLKPGQESRTIWDRFNAFMREHGRDEERRLNGHGQGYDIVERPLLRFDESAVLEEDMYLAFHPVHTVEGLVSWFSENYVVGPDGVSSSIHRYPLEIISV